jgi:uncharacterized repeat protein (TIGR04138 family)
LVIGRVGDIALLFRGIRGWYIAIMPPPKDPTRQKKTRPPLLDYGAYPPEAYDFVQQGLSFTVGNVHGDVPKPRASRHVSGQQLCEGIRAFALNQYGMLAGTVLRLWNINTTLDFGRIVFALIEAGQMQKTDDDNVDDFRDVFDFKTAFEAEYRIPELA